MVLQHAKIATHHDLIYFILQTKKHRPQGLLSNICLEHPKNKDGELLSFTIHWCQLCLTTDGHNCGISSLGNHHLPVGLASCFRIMVEIAPKNVATQGGISEINSDGGVLQPKMGRKHGENVGDPKNMVGRDETGWCFHSDRFLTWLFHRTKIHLQKNDPTPAIGTKERRVAMNSTSCGRKWEYVMNLTLKKIIPGKITTLLKPELRAFCGDSLTLHHHLGWPTGGFLRYNLPMIYSFLP